MPETFALDPRLEADTYWIADLSLSQLLLMDNKDYPWLVLVPRIPNVREIMDLSPTEQHQLTDEVSLVSHVIQKVFKPLKINVAALGNVVSQLHVHVMGRTLGDPAWPDPPFGKTRSAYKGDEVEVTTTLVKDCLSGCIASGLF